MRYLFALLLVSRLAFCLQPCSSPTPACRETFEVSGRKVEVYRTYSLGAKHADITSAILVVHGVLRDADHYFANMVSAVRTAGHLEDVAVFAPRYQEAEDHPAANELYWDSGWKAGDDSVSRGVGVSSYEVMDELVREVASGEAFPNLKRIIVTGHSAGGQFAGRYAIGTTVEKGLRGAVTVDYVVANPSTWLYLTPDRVVPGTNDRFALPEVSRCPDYDEYHYGLEKRNRYMLRSTPSELAANLVRKHITIMVGQADTGTEYLDMSCGANLMGKTRYERGRIYYNYLERFFRPPFLELNIVPGVGHDNGKMYGSPQGLKVLFGTDSHH